MRNYFRGFGAVFYKEVLHVRLFSLVIPLLQMVVLGFGIDTNIRQINTIVFNADGRRESRELLDRLKNSDTFHVIRYVENDGDLNDAIIAGKARVGIKIPVDYSDRLLHNMSAQVLVLIDGSDSSVAGQAINVTTAIGLDESLRRVLHGIGFAELCLILTFMRFVFQVPIHGNVLTLAFLSLPYLFVSLSIGILVSSKANSQSEAIQLAFLTFLPSIFFSGYIFPRETMPVIFYVISYFIPASYYINITRGIILRGAGLSHLWLDGLALYAMGSILLLIAARRFQNKVIMA